MYAELERKICPRCKEAKEKKEFGKDHTTAKGISSWCKLCKKTWRCNHRKKNPELHKKKDFASDLKRHYGISVEEHKKIYNDQNGCCACCGMHAANFRRGLHMDHDHKTGQNRGLLCTRCNPGLGYFEDSIEKLEMAISYLKKFKK